MSPGRLLASSSVLAGAWVFSSCAPSGFADPTQIESVRIIASGTDKPYAPPGASVDLQVLAYDGRPQQPEPMVLYWIPFVCENPADDAYYSCFTQFEGGGGDAGMPEPGEAGDGGTPGGAGGLGAFGGLKPGVPIEGLPTGPSYRFTMPADAVTSHPVVAGAPISYGLAILFNVACAGKLELLPISPGNQNPQAVPIGCFDSSGNQLGPDDWVLGYTRVYAYDTLTNNNPIIDHVDVAGKTLAVTPQADAPWIYTTATCPDCLTVSHCASSNDNNCQLAIGPVVPSSSWEVNPEQTQVNGQPLHEEIWADFYTTTGQVQYSARLLYDPTAGLVGPPSDTDNNYQPPGAPTPPGQPNYIWIVVHDDRNGASWVTIPVQID
jgi:hypothetical protein